MNAVVKHVQGTSVLMRLAQRFGVDPDKMLTTLKATAFRGDVSSEQMMALAVVADQYGLNPWTKEIYAFPDRNNGVVPVVGVDGWSRIINSNPQFDGMDFEDGPLNKTGLPEWIECRMHRKDRGHPTGVREYLSEVYRDVGPWKSHPRRMLRHKAMIQCARLAFGFVGIFDEDEAARIIDVTPAPASINPRGDTAGVDLDLRDKHVSAIADILNADKEEAEIAQMLRDYDSTNFAGEQELSIAVADRLAAEKICSKAAYKEWLRIGKQ